MKYLFVLLLAASLSAKVVEKSCPICGQCEPEYVGLETTGINEYLPVWYCNSPSKEVHYLFLLRCDSTIKGDCDATLKWVPKRVEVSDSVWKSDYTAYLEQVHCSTNAYRDSVNREDAVIRKAMKLPRLQYIPFTGLKTVTLDTTQTANDSLFVDKLIQPKRKCVDKIMNRLWANDRVVKADTSWCDCDGDSTYWRMVVKDGMWEDSVAGQYVFGRYKKDTIYTRIESRWRRETKTVTTLIKRKPVTETVWR